MSKGYERWHYFDRGMCLDMDVSTIAAGRSAAVLERDAMDRFVSTLSVDACQARPAVARTIVQCGHLDASQLRDLS
jgi:hypothetical protein